MSAPTKPKGILYITIFYLAIAAIVVVLAILCFVPGSGGYQSFIQQFWYETISPNLPSIGDNTLRGLFNGYINPYVTAWGVVCIIVAGIVAVVAIMLFQLKVWGRNLTMLIALPLIAVLLGLIVLWYLFKDEVKAAFGPAPAAPAKGKAK